MTHVPQRISDALEPGEQLVWHGRPASHAWWLTQLTRTVKNVLFFGCAWYWRAELAAMFETYFGELPPVHIRWLFLGAILLTVMSTVGKALKLRRWDRGTWYAITDRRALTLPPVWFGVDMKRSFSAAEIDKASFRRGWLGLGSIVLSSEVRWSRLRNSGTTSSKTKRYGFFRLTNAQVDEASFYLKQALLELRQRDSGGRSGLEISRSPIGKRSVQSRTRTVEQPSEERFEIVPTMVSRWVGVIPLIVLVISLTMLNSGFQSPPVRQIIKKLPPAVSEVIPWVSKGLVVLLTLACVLAAIVLAFERKAWFDKGRGQFQPSGFWPLGTYFLPDITAVQFLNRRSRTRASSSSRFHYWHEINVVLNNPPHRVFICSVAGRENQHERNPLGDEPSNIAQRLAEFLNVPLLEDD